MAFALHLLLQSSMLVSPLHLEEQVPDGRALRAIVVVHRDTPGSSRSIQRSPEEARDIARSLLEELEAGADFAELARRRSEHASARYGGVVGTLWPRMMPPEVDEFLFSAELGQTSGVIDSPGACFVLQRIERDVAWRHIQVDGTGPDSRARCQALIERLRAGEDFAALARAESAEPVSGARGGVAGVFQRGPRDALLKKAAFDARPGEIVGPIDTPFALFVLQRIDPQEVDPQLREELAVRVRAIRVAFTRSAGMPEDFVRSPEDAQALAQALKQRIEAGEDMEQLAREHDDDPGGRERGGDLGWILRHATSIQGVLEPVFEAQVGELLGPFGSNTLGYVLLRRER